MTTMLGSLLNPLIKLAVRCGAVLFGTVLLTNLVTMPLHYMYPATPQIIRTIGAGVPLLCFGVGFLALVFGEEWRVLKYAAPVGTLAPSVVFGISFLFAIPQIVSLMNPIDLLLIISLIVSGVLIICKVFTGWLGGTPWINRTAGKKQPKPRFPEIVQSVAVSASTNSVEQVGAFEIVENPEDYIRESEKPDQKVWEPFRIILRGMMAAGAPVGYRLERIRGRTREYYLTIGKSTKSLQENMELLQRLLKSMLPKFRFKRLEHFTSLRVARGVAGTLSGELLTVEDPRQRHDPLTVVAEALLQLENGVFQTFAVPVAPGATRSVKRMLAGRAYRSKMQQAQHTVSTKKRGLFSSSGEESSTVVDIESATEADKLYRKYQRHRVKHACEAEISVACWSTRKGQSKRDTRLLLEVTKSAVVPGDPAKDLKIRIHRGTGPFQRIMEGRPIGQKTLLTLEESAILFTLPRCDIGIVFSKRETFSTATKPIPESVKSKTSLPPVETSERKLVRSEWQNPNHNTIFLGNPIGANGNPIAGRHIWFRPQKLESHLAIYGNTRSGKTTTALTVVAQAMKCGLKVLILVPRRSFDWTILMYLFPDSFWIFKAGDKSDISLRMNMFCPPPRVPVAHWIRGLGDLLSSWMPNDRVMRMHLDDVLHTTYRNCGWDSKTNKRGRPILLSDFWNAVEEVCLNIPYGDEIRQNFYGAIYSRISSLIRNEALVDMYNTEEGITWEQLANNNVLIDTQGLPADDDRSFLMGLLSTGIHMYKMAHPTRKITNLLVLEEASYVLKKPQDSDHYGPDSGHFAMNRIVDILTTGGGNGLGVLVLEQVAGRLMTDVIKLIVNTVAHALVDEPERILVGGHIGVDAKQIDHLHQMGKGETVVYIEGEGAPKSVKILPLNKQLSIPLPDKRVTDSEIKTFMEPVIQKHPGLKATTALPKEIIDKVERANPSNQSPPDSVAVIRHRTPSIEVFESQDIHEFVDHHMRDLAQNPKFVNNLVIRLEAVKEGNFEPLVKMVSDVSEEFLYEEVTQFWVAERLLVHSNDLFPDLLNKHLMNTALVMLQEQIG